MVTFRLLVIFDEAFQDWQDKQQFEEVKAFASEWGIDTELLSKSLKEYSLIKPEEIPFRDDISKHWILIKLPIPLQAIS